MYAGFMSNPAPGALEVVRAFVNSRDIDEGVEELASPAALGTWLAERDLLGERGAEEATAADLRRCIELREALRAHLRAHHGDALEAGAADILDAAARRARLTVRFTGPDQTALEPEAGGVDGALGRL